MTRDLDNNINIFRGLGEEPRISDNFIKENRGHSYPSRHRRDNIFPSQIIPASREVSGISQVDILPNQRYPRHVVTEPVLSIGAIKALEREAARPVTEEDLRRQRDNHKKHRFEYGPLKLIGRGLEAHATRVLDWDPMLTIYEYSELSPEELGEQEKARVMMLLEESGVGQALADDEALVIQRTEEELGKIAGNSVKWVVDIALQKDGLYRYARLGGDNQKDLTAPVSGKPIPIEDYPLYSDAVDNTVEKYYEAHKSTS